MMECAVSLRGESAALKIFRLQTLVFSGLGQPPRTNFLAVVKSEHLIPVGWMVQFYLKSSPRDHDPTLFEGERA